MTPDRFDHELIEKKWQERWKEDELYVTKEDSKKEKKYVLDMFPYPSGEGLHVGHPKGYIATDIYSRFSRMRGYEVLHPMGWDAFGLPAENFALKHKVHPRVAVDKNIANFKAQLAHIGFDYDWTREINTTDPNYYHWTQWIFLKMFEHGLAYESNEPINWCPTCMTGLANEDLDKGVCERCGTPVIQKKLRQWVLKITDYADRLLKDLDTLDWPEFIKEAQRNWIGRSEGAEITFTLSSGDAVTVFTTRPDTIFGATYLVLAPEHHLVETLAVKNTDEVRAYVSAAAKKTEIERGAEGKEKTGVELKGIKAINPATKEEIPVFIADYVLGGYGTGAIMAVPAHDERDFEFAKKFNIPVREVVLPNIIDERNPPLPGKKTVERQNVHAIVRDPKSGKYLGIKWKEFDWKTFPMGGIEKGETPEEAARREVLEETGFSDLSLVRVLPGRARAEYFAAHKGENRVAYTTAVIFDLASDAKKEIDSDEAAKHEVVWLDESELDYAHLTHAEVGEWMRQIAGTEVYTEKGVLVNSGVFTGKDSEEAKKEIVESVGGRMVVRYKIRDWVFSRQRYWGEPIPIIHCEKCGAVPVPYEDLPVTLPDVDHYEPSGTGESPLANIADWVNVTCPKCKGPAKRETNTMPQWAGSSWYYLRYMDPHNDEQPVSEKREKYWAPVDVYVGGDHAVRHLIYARFWHKFLYDIAVVSTAEPFARLEFLGFILAPDGRKMSKRLGNVINPDDVVKAHGADAFRLYEMFMGPFENTTAWSTTSISGTERFVERLWKAFALVVKEDVPQLTSLLQDTIKGTTDDIEAFKFNTAVSRFMVFLNAIEEAHAIGKNQFDTFIRLLAPFAPHITEELWEKLGNEYSIHTAPWPEFDPAKSVKSELMVVVQVNGKRRGAVTVAKDAAETDVVEAAKKIEAVRNALGGEEPKRVIYVSGKIINLVV